MCVARLCCARSTREVFKVFRRETGSRLRTAKSYRVTFERLSPPTVYHELLDTRISVDLTFVVHLLVVSALLTSRGMCSCRV